MGYLVHIELTCLSYCVNLKQLKCNFRIHNFIEMNCSNVILSKISKQEEKIF